MSGLSLSSPVPIPISKARIRRSNYSKRYSPKLGGNAEFESELEERHCVWREADPRVVALCPQPLRVNERIHGRKLNTIFDLWTKDVEGREILWEVKPYDRLKRFDDGTLAPAKWPQIIAWADANSIDVRFVTDREIDEQACLIDNWMRALAYVGPSATKHTHSIETWISDRFRGGISRTLGDLLAADQPHRPDDLITGLVRLLLRGQLHSDMDSRPFGRGTVIRAVD